MVVAETVSGLTALKTAFDMAKALRDIDDAVKRNSAVIELQEKILAAQQAHSEILQSVGELRNEVARLQTWDEERQRYKLVELRPGLTAYGLKDEGAQGEAAHQLCPSCYTAGHKSHLQTSTWSPGRCQVILCNDCGWYGYLTGLADPAHKDLRPKPFR